MQDQRTEGKVCKMNLQQLSDSDGKFSDMTPCEAKCQNCGEQKVSYRMWESSCGGYEDYKFTCRACGHSWWVEGTDA